MTFEQFAIPRLAGWLRFATVVCADRSLAEDVVQDVMLKVHQGWGRIGALDNPDAYVMRMLANEHVSWRRKWGRQAPTANVFEEAGHPTVGDPADAVADRAELVHTLQGLPRKQRAVLALRYLQDMPDDGIAEVLGCSTGTVRSHASRGLAALRVPPLDQLTGTEGTLDAR